MPDETGVNTKLITVLTDLTAALTAIALTHTDLQSIASYLSGIATDTHSELEAMRTQIADVQAVLGVAPGGPTTTLAGLLTIIQDYVRCRQDPCGPGPDDAGGCIEPFISTGQVAATDYGGRTFAVWNVDALPDGLSVGSFLAHDVANAQLVHADSGAWSVFVHSSGSPTFSISPDLDTLYATNRWLDISSNLDLAFNVPTGTDITVYLCLPGEIPFVDCVNIDSQDVTYYDLIGSSYESLGCQGIIFEGTPGLPSAATMSSGTTVVKEEGYVDLSGGILTLNAGSFGLQLVSGTPPITVIYVGTSANRDSFNLNTVGGVAVVPIDTVGLMITNVFSGGAVGTPFTIRICPPDL